MRLTREHSEALRLARRLQASHIPTAADDRRELLRFWYGSGGARLGVEQQLVVDTWGHHGGADHPLAAAIETERARLSRAVAAVASAPHASPVTLRAIGRDLGAHVRRQERELYGAVERVLSSNELEDVERDLARFRRRGALA